MIDYSKIPQDKIVEVNGLAQRISYHIFGLCHAVSATATLLKDKDLTSKILVQVAQRLLNASDESEGEIYEGLKRGREKKKPSAKSPLEKLKTGILSSNDPDQKRNLKQIADIITAD